MCPVFRGTFETSWVKGGLEASACPAQPRDQWMAFETFLSLHHPHACSDKANWSQDPLGFLWLNIFTPKPLSGLFLSPYCSVTGLASPLLPCIYTKHHPELFLYKIGKYSGKETFKDLYDINFSYKLKCQPQIRIHCECLLCPFHVQCLYFLMKREA